MCTVWYLSVIVQAGAVWCLLFILSLLLVVAVCCMVQVDFQSRLLYLIIIADNAKIFGSLNATDVTHYVTWPTSSRGLRFNVVKCICLDFFCTLRVWCACFVHCYGFIMGQLWCSGCCKFFVLFVGIFVLCSLCRVVKLSLVNRRCFVDDVVSGISM